MFISSLIFAKPREDIRPLYRRILTNKRLDIANKIVLRGLVGLNLFGFSYLAVKVGLYIVYVRPLRRKQVEQLERDLIEAQEAGFHVMGYLQSIKSSYLSIFMVGMVGGVIFELFRVNFEYKGINFYKVYNGRQVRTRLDAYEQMLIEKDEASR